MDPVSMALAFFLNHPNQAIGLTNELTKPGIVDTSAMRQSQADLARGILTCYHKTARFQYSDVVEYPYSRQSEYGADSSIVLRINYTGMFTREPYAMFVAVIAKGNSVRTAVLGDNAVIPYSKACQLEEWSE